MRIGIASLLLTVVGLFVAGASAIAQPSYHEKPPALTLERDPIARLWWGTSEASGEAYRFLSNRPDHEAMQLLAYAQKIPKDEQGKGRRVTVISLLQHYGGQPHVVDFLVDGIDLYFRSDVAPEFYRSMGIADYPCAVTLFRTGQWFLPEVLRRLEFSDDVSDKALELYARLLVSNLPSVGDPVKELTALAEQGKAKAKNKRNIQNFDRFIAAIAKYGKPGPVSGTREEKR